MGKPVKQFSIPAYDKPGVLGKLAGALAKANINLVAISTEGSGVTAFIRIVADPANKVKKVLTKAGFSVFENDAYVADVPNKPGALARLSAALGRKGVNITAVYGTTGGMGPAKLVFAVDNLGKAKKTLS